MSIPQILSTLLELRMRFAGIRKQAGKSLTTKATCGCRKVRRPRCGGHGIGPLNIDQLHVIGIRWSQVSLASVSSPTLSTDLFEAAACGDWRARGRYNRRLYPLSVAIFLSDARIFLATPLKAMPQAVAESVVTSQGRLLTFPEELQLFAWHLPVNLNTQIHDPADP